MTVLTKDYARIVINETLEFTTVQNSTTVTLLSQEVSVAGGVQGVIPIVENYPPTPNITYSVRGIRLCTESEVAALKEYLFAGLGEPEASTELRELLYKNWGTPLQSFSGGDYIAAWYSEIGVGFHYFVGYDSTDYPTQTITTSAIQRVF